MFESSGISEVEGYEACEPDTLDDSLAGYSDVGISYNAETKSYVYDGKYVYFFYDPDGSTYVNYNGSQLKKLMPIQRDFLPLIEV